MMTKKLHGNAVLLGKNIDTDQIYPGRYLALVEPKEVAKHCLEGIDESVRKRASGNILVAGTNFGCGSSREHAVIALLNAGIQAVVAGSFARIFFRNAINLGLPVMICRGVSQHSADDDELSVDLQSGKIYDITKKTELTSEPLGDYVLHIVEAGGIKPLIRKNMERRKIEGENKETVHGNTR